MSHNAADSARYDEAGSVKPKNSRTAGTGSVHDPRPNKYPSTHEFASSKEENLSKVQHGRHARRPGGAYRKGHGFSTPTCTCGKHPCICGTEAVRSYHKTHPHENVNM